MWLHYFLFLFLLIVVLMNYYSKGKVSSVLSFITFAVLLLLVSLRAYDVGNDTNEYYRIFDTIKSVQDYSMITDIFRYESGYILCNYLISQVSDDFTVFLLIVSFFYLYSCHRFINKYIKNKFLGILFFFLFSMYYDLFLVLRQCLAVAVFLFAFDYLVSRNFYMYFILIFLASQFHNSAVLFSVLYFLPSFQIKSMKDTIKQLIMFILLCLISIFAFDYVVSLFPWFQHYATNSAYATGGVRSASIVFCGLRLFIVCLLFCFNKQRTVELEENLISYFNWFILIECLLAICSIRFNMIDRLENYVCLGYIAGILCYIDTLKRRRLALCLVVFASILVLSIFLEYRSNWYGIFPYKIITLDLI